MGSVFTFILLIVAMGCVTSIIQAHYRAKNGVITDASGNETRIAPPDDGERAMLRKEVEELRERVKVLERIVTDNRDGRSLAEQIESLRDR